jgi:hypothetical protein
VSIDRFERYAERFLRWAIDIAPLEAILGKNAKRKYYIRELTPDDAIHYDDRGEKLLRSIGNRTYSASFGIVCRDNPRHPLVSLIAAKPRRTSKSLIVHAVQASLSDLDPEEAGKLVHLIALVAQTFGYLANADTLRFSDVGSIAFQELIQAAGFEIKKARGGSLYAVRRILAPLVTRQIH